MRALLAAVLLALLSPLARAGEATVVVFVRHAEKATDDPRDPSLSEAGRARAEALARTLAGAGLDAAYATEFRRTRQTAAPAAEAAGLAVTVRPAAGIDPAAYAEALQGEVRALPAGSTVLVVGHSNTVPALVQAFSGQPAAEMPETEYDRYTVVVLDEAEPRVLTQRYGSSSCATDPLKEHGR